MISPLRTTWPCSSMMSFSRTSRPSTALDARGDPERSAGWAARHDGRPRDDRPLWRKAASAARLVSLFRPDDAASEVDVGPTEPHSLTAAQTRPEQELGDVGRLRWQLVLGESWTASPFLAEPTTRAGESTLLAIYVAMKSASGLSNRADLVTSLCNSFARA